MRIRVLRHVCGHVKNQQDKRTHNDMHKLESSIAQFYKKNF